MSNEKEKIQAGLAEYNASVEKTVARFPERGHLPEQRLYTPLDIEGTDYTEEMVSLVCILILVVFSLLCIVVVSGQCVCMQVSPLLKNPTNVIVI